MKLADAIRQIAISESDDMTICARRPWRADSDACVIRVPAMSKIPKHVIDDGYEYFLEDFIVREENLEMPEAKTMSE
jgi:hypothetical protein